MPKLDLFTLNCVTILNAYLSSSAMYFVSQLNGRTDGMSSCAAAGFVMATGFALAPFRDLLPAHVLNLASNLLIFAGTCLLLRGIRAFRGLRLVLLRRFIAAIVIYSSLFAYWMYGFDSLRARTILASFGIAATMAAAAWALGVGIERRDRPVYWTTASFYAATALAAGIRGVWFFRAAPNASLFSPVPIELVSIAVINLASMGGAFGLCLATNLRLMRAAEKLSLYDPLTNLPNRRLLQERLALAEQRSLSTGQPLALIYCDLDDFKNVNDQLGHVAGDKVLKMVASRLRGLLGEEVCLARVGGDEFIVLIEDGATREELTALVDNLSSVVGGIIHIDGQSVSPGMSCGLAIYPEDVESASDLMRLADAAMYSIKQQGKVATYLRG